MNCITEFRNDASIAQAPEMSGLQFLKLLKTVATHTNRLFFKATFISVSNAFVKQLLISIGFIWLGYGFCENRNCNED